VSSPSGAVSASSAPDGRMATCIEPNLRLARSWIS
jgi:hypothetical protein